MQRPVNNAGSLNSSQRSTNVTSLIREAKIERNKEKRKNVLMLCAAISALTISGLIITL